MGWNQQLENFILVVTELLLLGGGWYGIQSMTLPEKLTHQKFQVPKMEVLGCPW